MVYTHVAAALVGAAIAAVSAWQIQSWRWNATVDRMERYQAEQLQRAESAARVREQAMQRNAERIADEAEKKFAALAARVSAADTAARGLRDHVERLNARPAPTQIPSLPPMLAKPAPQESYLERAQRNIDQWLKELTSSEIK